MSLSKAVEIIIGVCVISAVITVNVMIAKHERAEASKQEAITNESDTMHDSRTVLRRYGRAT